MTPRKLVFLLTVFSLLLTTAVWPARADNALQQPIPPEVQQVFNKMSPEERVGQLFLVTFSGTDTGSTSAIHDLLVNEHVGGVVLQAANDNFVGAPNTVRGVYDLTSSLQQIEWEATVDPPLDPTTGEPAVNAYVPLFIAMEQDGDGPPGDQVLSGLTPLPSELSIGATWHPDLAEKVGEVMGGELAALGVNMYFGPSLDILEGPGATAGNDLGPSVFGGDPFWVSMMGSAYVMGLHTGANGKLLVVPMHFPGRGSADRSSDQEVATVRKSLDQLEQIELAPFFAVTRKTSAAAAMADGLLLSHIRYQGFQGNIRATTKPVSFDAQALSTILSLPDFAAWRDAGGLIVSDNLGTKAVRSFYSSGTDFPARTVARDAFVAGNDVLYLGNIISSDAPDNYSTVVGIVSSFVKKYREDPAFAQRVDASVLRILSMKNRLYGRFAIGNVAPPLSGLNRIGNSEQVTFDVARDSATLLSPGAQDLATLLQSPPKIRDRIIFFTDTSQAQQCSTCPAEPRFRVDALQNAIVQLYGPESGNLTSSFRVASYSLQDAADYLEGKAPPYLAENLGSAAWVVISLVDNANGEVQLISNFLAEKQDLLRDKRVILFAFGAPYYLDATDISRLTAYYALYSKQAPFVQVAARLLFQELSPTGASPVSIPSLGYDLISVTAPNPNQIITLALDLPGSVTGATDSSTPQPTAVPLFKIGDTIGIRTGIIKDHNGEPVPDGTVVQFSMDLTGEGGGILHQAEATTVQGIARVSFGLDKPGLLGIRATSDPARVSEVLQLDVSSSGQPAAVTVIVPALTPQPELRVPGTPIAVQDEFVTSDGALRFSAWMLTVLMLVIGAVLVSLAGIRIVGQDWGLRWGLSALVGGLLPYNYLALGMPGGATFVVENRIPGIVLLCVMGLLLGWAGAWAWWWRNSVKRR